MIDRAAGQEPAAGHDTDGRLMTGEAKPERRLADRLARPGLLIAPGVYDMISARIADRMGFDALYITGYGVTASHLGVPDAGIATYTDMVSRVAQIAGGTKTPVVADADTGYGGLLNVRATVQGFERAGAAAIQLEDQTFPKKCGHTPGRDVVPVEDMVQKLRVAAESRSDPGFLIIARTDARAAHGLDEALRRGEAYARAGADALFIVAPESEQELEIIGRNFDLPLVANNVQGGVTPVLPAQRLEELGFRIVIYSALGFLAAAAALEKVYEALRSGSETEGLDVPLYGFERMHALLGFEDVWEFERRFASDTGVAGTSDSEGPGDDSS